MYPPSRLLMLPALLHLLLLLLGHLLSPAQALSCNCDASPCRTPSCCPSGEFVPDPCHCCSTCASPEGGRCGGPWGIDGRCAQGLSCLRRCRCKTRDSRTPCIFPFKYKGRTYTECTKDGSTNGEAWCAVEVDSASREVVPNQWEDCSGDCPGTQYPCTEGDLFNVAGICVSQRQKEDIEKNPPVEPYKFDESSFPEAKKKSALYGKAPKCPKGSGELKEGGCVCSKEIPNGEVGHCKPTHFGPDSKGWCFLEHVKDPSNPKKSCYPDVEWSSSSGRFWSSEACQEEGVEKESGAGSPVVFQAAEGQ